MKFFSKLKDRLSKKNSSQDKRRIQNYVKGFEKTNKSFLEKIRTIKTRNVKVNEEFFEKLEEALISADISYEFIYKLIEKTKLEAKLQKTVDPKETLEIFTDKMFELYMNDKDVESSLKLDKNNKNIILVVGVNGTGKTTTIAKIAHKLKMENDYKILVAGADTFRAAATEQLKKWTDKVGVDFVGAQKENQDPSSVVYQALEKLENEDYNLLIIDTAGRMQNKVNLMEELNKINKTIFKKMEKYPQETLLVLDSTTGQNAISQAQSFKEIVDLTGIVLTKMDGTSKGGIIFSIKDKLNIPVKFVGVGEKIEDIEDFDLDAIIYGFTSGVGQDE